MPNTSHSDHFQKGKNRFSWQAQWILHLAKIKINLWVWMVCTGFKTIAGVGRLPYVAVDLDYTTLHHTTLSTTVHYTTSTAATATSATTTTTTTPDQNYTKPHHINYNYNILQHTTTYYNILQHTSYYNYKLQLPQLQKLLQLQL